MINELVLVSIARVLPSLDSLGCARSTLLEDDPCPAGNLHMILRLYEKDPIHLALFLVFNLYDVQLARALIHLEQVLFCSQDAARHLHWGREREHCYFLQRARTRKAGQQD